MPSFDQALKAAIARANGGVSPLGLSQTYIDWAQHLLYSPDKQVHLARKAAEYWERYVAYCSRAATDTNCDRCIDPRPEDRRFDGEDWEKWPFNALCQAFLLTQEWWREATVGVAGVSKHHQDLVSFVARQILDAFSPFNFPHTNPVVLSTTLKEGGGNFLRGAMNLQEDWFASITGKKPIGADRFEVGRNVAVTPGKIVFRNRLIELIQYAATTDRVQAEPILIVPAWIMKYYILDLSPENSLVRYLTSQGFTVFAISWKNPTAEDQDVGLDQYRELGVFAALEAVSAIVPGQKVHAVGYCLGGTLLCVAAAAMARDGDERLMSISLFAAQADFTEAGDLMLFIDEAQVSFLEAVMADQGFLDIQQMISAFQWLRSHDLIWSTLVRSYLIGKRLPMTDLMAWNADATRMPYRMHSEYLRYFFLRNDLAENRYMVGGRPVSLRDIHAPVFAVSTMSDHVAPWRSVYKIQNLTDTDVTFVLSNAGHNAGIVNPPGHPHRHHQIATHKDGEKYIHPNDWQRSAVHHEGSWWPCWRDWLVRRSSQELPPPSLGAPQGGYPILADAPGTYVFER